MLNQRPQALACTGCPQLFEGDWKHNDLIEVTGGKLLSSSIEAGESHRTSDSPASYVH